MDRDPVLLLACTVPLIYPFVPVWPLSDYRQLTRSLTSSTAGANAGGRQDPVGAHRCYFYETPITTHPPVINSGRRRREVLQPASLSCVPYMMQSSPARRGMTEPRIQWDSWTLYAPTCGGGDYDPDRLTVHAYLTCSACDMTGIPLLLTCCWTQPGSTLACEWPSQPYYPR